jgi:D-alanyl-lipoteichoic acid acyltransferase DltB (MBOAT superfamily)
MWLIVLIGFAGYVLSARLILFYFRGVIRDILFALLNIPPFFAVFHNQRFAGLVYFLLVVFCYAALRLFSTGDGWRPWLAFFSPIAALIFARYIFPPAYVAFGRLPVIALYGVPQLIGFSYLAFRNSHLVLEIRNGVVKRPGFWGYMGYSFFLPTMFVGPINPYSNFRRALSDTPPAIPVGRSALRLMVGLVKFEFLGNILNRLTYDGLLRDDHYHSRIDLPIAVVCYYLYLYCNFSGFCDIAIGLAGLIGIPVAENFQNPFSARNVKDFWNRWHITLSQYMRDVVFAPLSKSLVRLFGLANANHAIALTIFLVFLLIGIWHGVGWNYAAFGAIHGLGVAANHYYTIALKKWLGRDGFKAYNSNRWIHAGAVCLTFCYVAASLFFFANTFPQMKEIFKSLL